MKALNKRSLEIGRKTDVGRIRVANEDSMGDLPVEGGHVFIVADGMGGYRGGAIASSLVVEAIEEYFLDTEVLDPHKALRESIFTANERIYLRGKQDEELSRMGSTCVLALITDDRLHLAHVGDSRIYLVRQGGSLQRLTRDHTVVQHFVDVGLLREEEAEGHPDSHILSRALGPRAHVEPELRDEPIFLRPGDRVLLCSDGLTKMLTEEEINSLLIKDLSLQEVAERLVELANQHGGEDNVTVLVVEYSSQQSPHPVLVKPDQELDFSDDTPPLSQSLEAMEHHQPSSTNSSKTSASSAKQSTSMLQGAEPESSTNEQASSEQQKQPSSSSPPGVELEQKSSSSQKETKPSSLRKDTSNEPHQK